MRIAVDVDDCPVVLLVGGGVELGDMARFAAKGVDVAVFIGQPIVRAFCAVAVDAGAHGVFDVWGDHALGTVATSKLMKRFFEIFANFKTAGVKN